MKFKNYFLVFLMTTAGLCFVPRLQAATITPNIFTDPSLNPPAQPGDCSLRYAIQAINTGGPFAGCTNTIPAEGFGTNDTILLQAGPYVLTIMGHDEDDNETGDLDVNNKDIKIIGAGSNQTSIDASGIPDKDRVIQFNVITNANLTGVTLKGGDVSGLGEEGGGIFAQTIFLTLQDVQVIGNMAGIGGGISASCQPSIMDSIIQGNKSIVGQGSGDAGGIFLFSDDPCSDSVIATIKNSFISGNQADSSAGGIYLVGVEALIFENSTIDGNTALNGCGGALFSDDSSVVGIANSTISRNEAPEGGGICDGGIYFFLTNSTVSTNTAQFQGGGINSGGGLKGVYNVTVAFNKVTEDQGEGGGIFRIEFPDQFKDNRFDIQFFNTIIAKNTADLGPDCFGIFNTGGFNLIGNVGANDDCTGFAPNTNNDLVGTPGSPIDPLLLALSNYGGTTETHALDLNSPAVDAGNNVDGCEALDQELFINSHEPDTNDTGTVEFIPLDIDQRFFTRPIAIRDPNTPICDIGAFELQTFTVELTKDDGLAGAPVQVGDSFTYTIVMTNNGPGDADNVILSDPLPPQVSFDSVTSSQGTCAAVGNVVNCDLGTVPAGGVVTVHVTVTAEEAGDAVNTATVSTSVGDFTATVTTRIQEGIIEGSGILPCELQQGAVQVPPRLAWCLLMLTLSVLAAHGWMRRRARS